MPEKMRKIAKQSQVLRKILLTILLCIILVNLLSRIVNAPFDYDEGYNLQVALNLRQNIKNYATFETIFDSNITTGPTVLFPAALFLPNAFPSLPRIVMFLYVSAFFLLTLWGIYKKSVEKIIFLLVLMVLPMFYFFSVHILGEVPGFVFFLLSLLCFKNQKYFLSGGAFFLSVITKNIYVLTAIPLLYLLFSTEFPNKSHYAFEIGRRTGKFLAGICLFLFLWQLYILTSLNFNIEKYVSISESMRAISSRLSNPNPHLIESRLTMLQYIFTIDPFFFIFLLIFISLSVFWFCRKKNNLLSAISLFCLFYFFYFLLLGSTNWYRHLFPGILAAAILIPAFLMQINFKNRKSFSYVSSALVIFLLVNMYSNTALSNDKQVSTRKLIEQNLIFLGEGYFPFFYQSTLLTSQLNIAAYINNNIPKTSQIAGISWWNAPEISYLTRRKIERNPFTKENTFVISHFYGQLLSPVENRRLFTIKDLEEIFHSPGYSLYKKP